MFFFKKINKKYLSIEMNLRKNGFISYKENYKNFLIKNKIINYDETPESMFERVANTLAKGGKIYYGESQEKKYQPIFHELLTSFKVILSTPIYTNAGRHETKSLSACAIPPINFKNTSASFLKNLIQQYHVKGMGTGFNFDEAENPSDILKLLNGFAVEEVSKGMIERPVGNMGILSVDHPRALEFISVKTNSKTKDWKFNISINLTSEFMRALNQKKAYTTSYQKRIYPEALLYEIANNARQTGDPGVAYMHKYEESNKTPHLGHFVSLAPCGEVPLLNGEVCHFGYINLYKFIKNHAIDYEDLKKAIHHTVIMLDNAIEFSISRLPTNESASIIEKIRKIGVGICGFADALIALGIPYHSEQAIKFSEDIISYINFESKLASINLAKMRGPFPAFRDAQTKKELIITPYINCPTETISSEKWRLLNNSLLQYGIRNISTVILPPTGRSSLLGAASASIEPHFKLVSDDKLVKSLKQHLAKYHYQGDFGKIISIIDKTGSILKTDVPQAVKEIYLTCLELPYDAHIKIVSTFQKFTDEAIAKTINLPENSKAEDISEIYQQAYHSGLKGITVFVDKCRNFQPKELSENTNTFDESEIDVVGSYKF